MRTSSLGSGGWNCEAASTHLHPNPYAQPWTQRERGEEGEDGRRERFWYADVCFVTFILNKILKSKSFFCCDFRTAEEGWGRTWKKRNFRHHSTEEEDEEEEEEEEELWTSAEMRRLIFARTHTPGSGI